MVRDLGFGFGIWDLPPEALTRGDSTNTINFPTCGSQLSIEVGFGSACTPQSDLVASAGNMEADANPSIISSNPTNPWKCFYFQVALLIKRDLVYYLPVPPSGCFFSWLGLAFFRNYTKDSLIPSGDTLQVIIISSIAKW
ncbi:uncharacterized protein BDR25DRAFT_41710 [Lindgomyces ingoldianus]|uniref:Uncharacterized protein n=1 Tax=Lindgomyces ingoldianus TaxID=673940 RepID=A0ACB6REV0_9PLEO|nr:uncharacterized protein BDR25DRAFT_41710 [Lindgomyces ingoldianus]KAF2476857.1 hypothetical protein BDR25DRAFT_41710 [Lindgomyces ingoldianus]